VKRLVESLARREALVFVSGHWEAWEQQGDFLDRFIGSRPIQLVRLNADDVLKIVAVRASEWRGFEEPAARAVVEATQGNIRRVMTVLYDLYADPQTREYVTPDAVFAAALRRLQQGSDNGILPTIEAAARARGAGFERNVSINSTEVDAVVRVEDEIRLIVRIVHARDEFKLIGEGRQFAELVRSVRENEPRARGLFIALGAVNDKHLATLDAAFAETDLVNGEVASIVQGLPEIIAKAVAPRPELLAAQPIEVATASLKRLDDVERAVVERADQQIARSEVVFGPDARSEAVRQTVVPDPEELSRQKAEIARREAVAPILEDAERPVGVRVLSTLARSPTVIGLTTVGLLLIAVGLALPDTIGPFVASGEAQFLLIRYGALVIGALLLAVSSILVIRIWLSLAEFRRFEASTLRQLYVGGAPAFDLERTHKIIEAALLDGGPHAAQALAFRELYPNLRREGTAMAPAPAMH
jgi:hypothetical protein